MKKVMLSCLLLCSGIACANESESQLRPLWEEDQHFCYYRTLCIEGSVCQLGELIKEVRRHPEDLERLLDCMDQEVTNCKNSLGIPRD